MAFLFCSFHPVKIHVHTLCLSTGMSVRRSNGGTEPGCCLPVHVSIQSCKLQRRTSRTGYYGIKVGWAQLKLATLLGHGPPTLVSIRNSSFLLRKSSVRNALL